MTAMKWFNLASIARHVLRGLEPDQSTHENSDINTEIPRAGIINAKDCIIIAFISLIVISPALIRGFPNGDDAYVHYRWAVQFAEGLRDGNLYPRWLASANFNQGSPASLFYPPFSLYSGALFRLLTGNASVGLSLSCFFGLLISGITMRMLAGRFIKSPYCLLASILYLIAPYHVFDLYQASSISEFWALAWIPLVIIYSIEVGSKPYTRNFFLLAGSYALLILTNLPIAIAAAVALPLVLIIATRKIEHVIKVCASCLTGALLCGFYLLPVLIESKYIRLHAVLNFDYRQYFLFEHLRKALGTPFFSGLPQSDEISAFIRTANSDLLKADIMVLHLAIFLLFSLYLLYQKGKWAARIESSREQLRP